MLRILKKFGLILSKKQKRKVAIIIVLMLKELGLDETHLKYDINSNETVATIEIPLDSYAEL